MDSHNLLRVTLKLTGLFLMISGGVETAQSLPIIVHATVEGLTVLDGPANLIAYILPVIIGAILWLAPHAVSNTIIQSEKDSTENTALIHQVERIAIGILGLYFLYLGLLEFVATLLEYQSHNGIEVDTLPRNYSLYFKVIGFQIFLSICLIVGSNGLQKFIHKIRYAS
jgi:hypothetical protein